MKVWLGAIKATEAPELEIQSTILALVPDAANTGELWLMVFSPKNC